MTNANHLILHTSFKFFLFPAAVAELWL